MIKRKQQQTSPPDSDSGFTIIESLVAIVVVAILMAAIAPVLVMSTSIRVQSRRVELSTQAARTFIDGVRNGSIAAPSIVSTLTAATTTSPRNLSLSTKIPDYLISTTEMPAPTSATGLYCLRKDGVISNVSTDCSDISNINFYVQAGRIVQSTGTNDGYRMAIRVYRADVEFPASISTLTSEATASSVTGKLGDKKAPLVEMTTDITNTNTSFKVLCQRLGAAPGTTLTCQ